MQTAIKVEGLQKNYGNVKALNGVNLNVEPGTIFGLVGSNGAGKSTLINLNRFVQTGRGNGRRFGLQPVQRTLQTAQTDWLYAASTGFVR
jgi:ABC-2 type transport system ATP-binding protein